jgi:predicted nucleic acid-binding protein
MLRFFIDSSVLFSMVYSEKGAAYELAQLALIGQVQLLTSEYAFAETRDNLPDNCLDTLDNLKSFSFWEIVDANEDQIETALEFVDDPADAPILAAARSAKINALVSFDRKHLHTDSVADFLEMPVLTAGGALAMLRALESDE